MKKYQLAAMAFTLLFFMMGSGVACADSDQEKLVCDVCGGTVEMDRMVQVFGLIHARECRHRATDPSQRTLHDKNGVWTWDEKEHWLLSACCGLSSDERSNHVRDCQGEEKCVICGMPYSGSGAMHSGEMQIQSDGRQHWDFWPCCGLTEKYDAHWRSCDQMDVCAYCGIACQAELFHTGAQEWKWDDERHWRIMTCCGTVTDEPQAH